MYKLNIICPFCLEELKKWKLVKIVPKSYSIVLYKEVDKKTIEIKSTRNTTEIDNELDAVLFERKILKEHLDNCSMRNYLSVSLLQDCYRHEI